MSIFVIYLSNSPHSVFFPFSSNQLDDPLLIQFNTFKFFSFSLLKKKSSIHFQCLLFTYIQSISLSIRLDTDDKLIVSAFWLFFFFEKPVSTFQWVPCTVYGTHKHLFLAKLLFKMDSTVLFTYLKIILL